MIFDEYILGLPVGGNVLKCLKSKLKKQKDFIIDTHNAFEFILQLISYA